MPNTGSVCQSDDPVFWFMGNGVHTLIKYCLNQVFRKTKLIVNLSFLKKLPGNASYQNFTKVRHKDVLCLTGDTQKGVVYHFYDFMLHQRAICRLYRQVSSIVIRFPGGKHLSRNRQPKRQPNRQPAHAITYRVARPFPSALIRFCSTICASSLPAACREIPYSRIRSPLFTEPWAWMNSIIFICRPERATCPRATFRCSSDESSSTRSFTRCREISTPSIKYSSHTVQSGYVRFTALSTL